MLHINTFTIFFTKKIVLLIYKKRFHPHESWVQKCFNCEKEQLKTITYMVSFKDYFWLLRAWLSRALTLPKIRTICERTSAYKKGARWGQNSRDTVPFKKTCLLLFIVNTDSMEVQPMVQPVTQWKGTEEWRQLITVIGRSIYKLWLKDSYRKI